MYSREGVSGQEAQGRGHRRWRDADVEVRQTRDAPRAHSLGSGSPRPNVKIFQSTSLIYVLIQFVSFRSSVPYQSIFCHFSNLNLVGFLSQVDS